MKYVVYPIHLGEILVVYFMTEPVTEILSDLPKSENNRIYPVLTR